MGWHGWRRARLRAVWSWCHRPGPMSFFEISNGLLSAKFCATGASLVDLRLAEVDHSLVLGMTAADLYSDNPAYMGSVVGRVGNRIGGAQFDIGDGPVKVTPNEGLNQLHGGPKSWSHQRWDLLAHKVDRILFGLSCPQGFNGFPGAVEAVVTYSLSGQGLDVEIEAHVSAPTPLALTTHSYFNLGPVATIDGHSLEVPAFATCELDEESIPTGELIPLDNPHLDMGQAIDLNFCIANAKDGRLRHHATLVAPGGKLRLEVHSNEPGCQIYTGDGLPQLAGEQATRPIGPRAGVALEPQLWPNAVNLPQFPNAVCLPGEPYKHLTRFQFG